MFSSARFREGNLLTRAAAAELIFGLGLCGLGVIAAFTVKGMVELARHDGLPHNTTVAADPDRAISDSDRQREVFEVLVDRLGPPTGWQIDYRYDTHVAPRVTWTATESISVGHGFFPNVNLRNGDTLQVGFVFSFDAHGDILQQLHIPTTPEAERLRQEEIRKIKEARRLATTRAEKLLGKVLGKKELARYRDSGAVWVYSRKDPDIYYSITAHMYTTKVSQSRSETMGTRCVVAADSTLPQADQVLTLALWCRADEKKFWQTGIPHWDD